MKSDQDEADKMSVNYAAAKCFIKNANAQNLQKSSQYVKNVVETTLLKLLEDNKQDLVQVQ